MKIFKPLYLVSMFVAVYSVTVSAQTLADKAGGIKIPSAPTAGPLQKSQIETPHKIRIEKDPLGATRATLPDLKVDPSLGIRKTGTGSSGGGTGCRGLFAAAAHQVGLWLETNGNGLRPKSVRSTDFLQQIHPLDEAVIIVPDTEHLTYKGENVTAFFDGQLIQVRCDRLNRENPVGLKRVVAHEIFRKMGLEGDDYHYTKQVLGPAWVAADIAYALDKRVEVLKFSGQQTSLVKITTRSGDAEFFGIRECPNTAMTETAGNVEIAWESCSLIGGNYYKVSDFIGFQKLLSSKIEKIMTESNSQRPMGLLILGNAFVASGLLVYASDNSKVRGMKQIGEWIDRTIYKLFPQMNFRSLMATKAGLSAVSLTTGLLITLQSFSAKQQLGVNADLDFKKNDITLRSGNGYLSFGMSLIFEFKNEHGIAPHTLRNLIVESMSDLEDKKLIQSFGKPQ